MRRIAPSPVKRGLSAPALWLGCDPMLLTLLGTLCGTMGLVGLFAFHDPALTLAAVVLFWAGRKGLVIKAKDDPLWFAIMFRNRYARTYDAVGRWDDPDPEPRSWS